MTGDSDVKEGEILREAYEDLDYRMEEVHENLSVPTASPARFEYLDAPRTTDAESILEWFGDSTLTLIDVSAENGEEWYEFSVGGQVWTKTDERARLSVSTAGVSILKKREELSYEGFVEVVEAVEWSLAVDLGYVGRGPEETE